MALIFRLVIHSLLYWKRWKLRLYASSIFLILLIQKRFLLFATRLSQFVMSPSNWRLLYSTFIMIYIFFSLRGILNTRQAYLSYSYSVQFSNARVAWRSQSYMHTYGYILHFRLLFLFKFHLHATTYIFLT